MATFEDLELPPELVESLAAEGIETPTAVQRDLIPVIRRGNNVVAVAGPGSGIVAAWAAPLLERVQVAGDSPRVLVLTPTADRAVALAEAVGRLALATGHRVAALDSLWVLPERAHILVGTPDAVQARVAGGQLSLEALEAVVVDGAASLEAVGSLDRTGAILEGVAAEAQRVVVALPATAGVEAFADRHARKSVHVPPGPAAVPSPHRGELTVMEVGEDREDGALRAVSHLLLEARHVLAFARSEDAAADLGDHLALRGYVSGRPGAGDVPVWLAVDALEARSEMEAADAGDVVVLSVDAPGDADTLDQRHGGGRGGVILALPRELPHVKAVAGEAGYTLATAPLPEAPRGRSGLAALMASLEAGLESQDVEAYQVLLEPLFARHGAAAVAGAAVALLRSRQPAERPAAVAAAPGEVPAYVRLFMSVGKMDNVRPGDLVGAITGEAGVDASQLGRIELRDTFSLVEVEPAIADRVIRALNGTTIRGRAARVDYHRDDRRGERAGASERRPPARGGRDDRRPGPRDGRDDRRPGSRGDRGPRPGGPRGGPPRGDRPRRDRGDD